MFVKKKVLEDIIKRLDYQQKLLESIYGMIDEAKNKSASKKSQMEDYLASMRSALEKMGGGPNAAIMKPINDMLERLKNDR